MSIRTNRFGVPAAIIAALENDPYYSGGAELTASSIGSPPQIRHLWRIYGDRIEIDASDELYKLYGQAMHVVLERANRTEITEKRLHAMIAGARLSCQLDTVTVVGGEVTEWKLTSVWTAVYGGREEWIDQMNVQAAILRANGVEVRSLKVVALFRDWSKSKAKAAAEKNRAAGRVVDAYPIAGFTTYDVDLWSSEEAEAWIAAKVKEHRAAALGAVRKCTDDERWIRRGGLPTRCLEWCEVSKFCPQHREWLANQERIRREREEAAAKPKPKRSKPLAQKTHSYDRAMAPDSDPFNGEDDEVLGGDPAGDHNL